ncbi:phosphoenolpyruvate--protein phosphotransferase [Paludibacterium paludis]|uniref:phosphoenolpyruvate--protein phosphotransferase n=1 Tax=Paludibacterium paludis TaxID=1225769 RepID=A0A918P1K9_9NEIS|nr:phosphoenolpyruvate--protein phosphotransferase [Paludibacterium paludis]GGY13423.1 phosphoenolpyruvate--protein phosphotransferase [Paludibacterium paludis]
MSDSMISLLAPVDGIVVPLQNVPDPVFSAGMMGDGVAIEPLSPRILAPADGVVRQVARTFHALTLTTRDGVDVLIHIGIDTVNLGGEGFTAHVAAGDTVSAGQCLVEVDLDRVARRAVSLVTLVLLPEGGQLSGRPRAGQLRAGVDSLGLLRPGDGAMAAGGDGPEARASAIVRHAGGLHARPAAMVQAAARAFSADIQVEYRGHSASARSVVALMGLGVGEDDDVTVLARGEDAAAAADAVIRALQTRTRGDHAAAPSAAQAGPDGGIAGVCASAGMAIGRIHRLDAVALVVEETAGTRDEEFARLSQALVSVREAIQAAIADAARRRAAAEESIFTAHLALADDPELIALAERGVIAGKSASVSVRDAVEEQGRVLLALGNPLLAERVADLRDLGRRLLVAMGMPDGLPSELPPESIVVADDLLPSDLNRLPRERLAGLVLARGGATSHLAIIARAMGLPTLVAVGERVRELSEGQRVILDSAAGRLDPEPGEVELDAARARIAERENTRRQLLENAGGPALTQDGCRIDVAANVANAGDAAEAAEHGADGVGLLRTELLFIERDSMPDENEQREACQAVFDALGDRPVIVRTLDVGGDKDMPYLPLPAEDNPALGLRGIRTGFARPEVLDVQLRALLALKPLSRLRILIPMIAEVAEVRRVRERIDALCAEAGIGERPELGVMIEVPSAAVLADQLAREADFLSIGTNDLTQYTLAMDRCHAGLADRLDPFHPALLRLIAMTVAGARKHGKWVGVCGAMASDSLAVPVLLGLGVTELSVAPVLVPEIKARVRSLAIEQCRKAAEGLLLLDDARSVRERAAALWQHH